MPWHLFDADEGATLNEMSDPTIPNGTMLDARFRVDGVLGAGGFATVYDGIDATTGARVAIKVLHESHAESGVSRARFEREIQAVSQLRSPHTVRLLSHGEATNGTPFIVFEHVPGRDLLQVLQARGPMEPALVVHILRQILHSLHEAHLAGIIHRDIKPGNIRVFSTTEDAWSVKVLDFGIVRLDDADQAVLTRAGEMVGTPRYMSPEQLLSQPLGPASDIYSLGVVVVEMLLGSDAIQGYGLTDQLTRLQTGHLFSTAGQHAKLQRLVERMTARNVKDRFATAHAVLAALDVSTGGPTAAAPPAETEPMRAPPPLPPLDLPSRVEPTHVAVGVLSVLLLGALGYIVVEETRADPSVAPPPTRRALSSGFAKGDRPSEPPTVAPTVADAGRAPPASGCGEDPGWTGDRHFALRVDNSALSLGIDRTYMVHLPARYESTRAYPLVMLFQTAVYPRSSFVHSSGAHDLADREGFIVLSFDKIDDTTVFQPGDHALVRAALSETAALACVDPQRLFAVAHGLGGQFAREVACEVPLAGLATAGDWVSPGPVKCEGAVPFIRIVGHEDLYAPIDGGRNCMGDAMKSLAQIEADWRIKNKCDDAQTTWLKRGSSTCTTWGCAEAPFVSCRIAGGHFWPGATPGIELPLCARPVANFPIMDTIWKFFEEQPSSPAVK